MVKVEVTPEETKALVDLMSDAKCPPEMGYLLVSLKFKIMEAFKKDQIRQNKIKAQELLGDA